jgi:hypothetical protein
METETTLIINQGQIPALPEKIAVINGKAIYVRMNPENKAKMIQGLELEYPGCTKEGDVK